jgi:hypothetical protein
LVLHSCCHDSLGYRPCLALALARVSALFVLLSGWDDSTTTVAAAARCYYPATTTVTATAATTTATAAATTAAAAAVAATAAAAAVANAATATANVNYQARGYFSPHDHDVGSQCCCHPLLNTLLPTAQPNTLLTAVVVASYHSVLLLLPLIPLPLLLRYYDTATAKCIDYCDCAYD